MKNIGITTTIYGNNFGEALQAYAMRKAVNIYCPDCNAEIIKFVPGIQKSIYKPGFEEYDRELEDKQALFQNFRETEMGAYGTPETRITKENAPRYDAYIFGSDQIWNTQAWKIPEFFGDFVPENAKKIAYAASVGIYLDNDELDVDWFKKYMPSFDYLSVRESIHCKFIEQFVDKEVKFVADPTMLIPMNYYEEMVKKAKVQMPSKNYIFYYQPHSADGAAVSLVNKLARYNKMDVVHTFANIPERMFPNESVSARFGGPYEFLAYIKNSSLVITKSYHAAVFSILFERPFYVLHERKAGSRFVSLLGELGLQDRLLHGYVKPEELSFDIDYSEVRKRLSDFKTRSIDFLRQAVLD